MDYIQSIIEEQVANRRLFERMYTQWKLERPGLTEEQAQRPFEYFMRIKNNLRPTGGVLRFLNHYNGIHAEKFKTNRLKDITAYSIEQLLFLIRQYRTDDDGFSLEEAESSDFGKLSSRATPEFIEKSKKLWEGDKHKVIDEGSLRVYYIPNQKVSVQFGYYLEELNKQTNIAYSNMDSYANTWCISVHSDRNLWSNYRNNRTFYFVIDEEKDDNDENKLVAIQRDTSVSEDFRITTRKYDNDPIISWEDIVSIFPKLAGHENVLKPVDYEARREINAGDEGTANIDIVQLLSEDQASEYYIGRQDRSDIVDYITRGFTFTSPVVWDVLDDNLRQLYINSIEQNTVVIKISNLDMLNAAIRTNGSLLKTRLTNIGYNGTVELRLNLMNGEYSLGRYNNIEESDKLIYKNKTTGKFGIFNNSIDDWYEKDSTVYGPQYNVSSPAFFKNKNNESDKFFIVTYSTGVESENFYCVIPLRGGNKSKGYLLSAVAFEKLEAKIIPGNLMHNISKDPEQERDIYELEKE